MPLIEILARTTPPEDARAVMEFEKLRFELSWRYFDFHARQRTQLFHFFIILAPFIFGGCFYLFKERATVGNIPGEIASCAGALLAIFFFGLDRRNRQIIHLSERAIRLIEAQLLFTAFRPLMENGMLFKGLLTTEKAENGERRLKSLRGHSFLVGAIYWIAFAAFAVLLAYFVAVHNGHIILTPPVTSSVP